MKAVLLSNVPPGASFAPTVCNFPLAPGARKPIELTLDEYVSFGDLISELPPQCIGEHRDGVD